MSFNVLYYVALRLLGHQDIVSMRRGSNLSLVQIIFPLFLDIW